MRVRRKGEEVDEVDEVSELEIDGCPRRFDRPRQWSRWHASGIFFGQRVSEGREG